MPYALFLLSVVIGLGLPSLAVSQTFASAPVIPIDTRPPPLLPLYIGFATTQVLDIHSSHLAISRGGREMNTIVRAVYTGRPWAAVALKVGVTAGVIVGAERMWRWKHRRAAVVVLAVVTAVQFGVDIHNYRIAAQLRPAVE